MPTSSGADRGGARRAGRRGALIVAALLVAPAPARAGGPNAVIESYVGERPRSKAFHTAISYLRRKFAEHGFEADPAVLQQQLRAPLPAPGMVDPSFTTLAFATVVESGLNEVATGRYKAAVATLSKALADAERNQAMLAHDPQNRATRLRGLIYLARAYKALDQAGPRDEVMRELIKLYPAKIISAKKEGPDAEAIYRGVASQLTAADASGQLTVAVDHDDVQIHVDAVFERHGIAVVTRKLAGAHSVLLVGRDGTSRHYRVELRPQQRARLDVRWDIDAALVTGDWIGQQFATDPGPARAGDLAVAFARHYGAGDRIIVITASVANHQLALSGAAYSASREVALGGATVTLTGVRDEKKLDQLAAFLAISRAGPDLAMIEVPHPKRVRFDPNSLFPKDDGDPDLPTPPVRSSDTGAHRTSRGALGTAVTWSTGSLGAAAMMGGVFLIGRNRGDTEVGTGLLLGGAAVTGFAIWYHLHTRDEGKPVVSAIPVGGGAFGTVKWQF